MASSNGAALLANTPEEKLALIKHNLQEVLNPEIIEDIVTKGERPLRIYLGTATTGRPHCGYFVWILKLGEFLAAGCEVTLLLADVHGFLDNEKAPIELVEERVKYYRLCITEQLKSCGVDISRLKFITGSEYQTTGETAPKYFFDLLRLSTKVSGHDASKAGSEVVKQVEAAPLSAQIYPLMQALDEEYLGVDAQFGGVDQRKIFTLAAEVLPRIGYRKRAHLMNPLVPGLQEGGKMSSSDPNSKIDIIDKPEVVKKKIKAAFCPPKQIKDNGVLAFIEYVLLPASALKNKGVQKIAIPRYKAEPVEYSDIKDLHRDYEQDIIGPQDVKAAFSEGLLALLAPIRKAYEEDQEWQAVEQRAYPPPPEVKKKVKKPKNLGTGYPGAKPGESSKAGNETNGSSDPVADGGVVAQPDGHVEGPAAEEVSVGKSPEVAMKRMSIGHARKGSKG